MKQNPSNPAIKSLTQWVNSAESTLLSDHVALAELSVMEHQLQRFQVEIKFYSRRYCTQFVCN